MDKQFRTELFRILAKVLIPYGRAADDIVGLVVRFNSSQKDIDEQVKEAMEALSNSTRLISDLETTLSERADKLQELQTEYERMSKLAEITEEQGAALAKTLEDAVGGGKKREWLVAFVINIVAGLLIFVLGVFASEWVKELPTRLVGPEKSVTSEQPRD